MTVTPNGIQTRAALYLRVSTARQAEHDVSIPDQRKQGETYCISRGLELVDSIRHEHPTFRDRARSAIVMRSACLA